MIATPAPTPVTHELDKNGNQIGWNGTVYKLTINGFEFYLLIDDDGQGGCARVAIRSGKMGSTMFGSLAALTSQTTQALDAGRRISEIVEGLVGLVYEPRGHVSGHPRVVWADSLSDLLGRVLADRYGIELDPPESMPEYLRSEVVVVPALAVVQEPAPVPVVAAPVPPPPPVVTRCPRCGHDPHPPGECRSVWCAGKTDCGGKAAS